MNVLWEMVVAVNTVSTIVVPMNANAKQDTNFKMIRRHVQVTTYPPFHYHW